MIPYKFLRQLHFYNSEAPLSAKSYHIEYFSDGSICAVNNKPRSVAVFYYCDYFNGSEATISEISEPDWCSYHVKIVTKYMCGKWSSIHERDIYEQINKKTKLECVLRLIQT